MPEFQYIAKELSGREVTGILTAGNEQEAINSLSGKALFPTRIALAEAEVRQKAAVGKRVGARHVAVIYSQLGDLLASGVPLLRSLEILEQQSSKPAVTGVLQDVRQQVAEQEALEGVEPLLEERVARHEHEGDREQGHEVQHRSVRERGRRPGPGLEPGPGRPVRARPSGPFFQQENLNDKLRGQIEELTAQETAARKKLDDLFGKKPPDDGE